MNRYKKLFSFFLVTLYVSCVQAQFIRFGAPSPSWMQGNSGYTGSYKAPGTSASERSLVFKMPYDTSLLSSDPLYRIQQGRRNGEYEKCLTIIDSLLKTDPANAAYTKEKIYLKLRMDKTWYDKAESLYQPIKNQLAPKEIAYLYTTILFYKNTPIETGAFWEVIETYSRVLLVYPADPLLFYNRAITYVKDGRFDLAEKDLLKASQLAPNDVQILYALGYCDKWLSKAKKGIVVLDKAESLMTSQVFEDHVDLNGFYSLRASLHNNQGNRERLEQDNKKAAEFLPRQILDPNPAKSLPAPEGE